MTKFDQAKFIVPFEGAELHCAISPCSWMYPGYGLQVGIALVENEANAATVFLNDKSVECHDQPLPLVAAMTLVAKYLVANGIAPLVKKAADWEVEQLALKAKYAKEDAAFAARVAREDAKMKAKGFTHKVEAWIHGHGDDYQTGFFVRGEPTPADIAKMLRKSTVKDDYRVVVL